MIVREAIKQLKEITGWSNFWGGCYKEKLSAIDMAIEALEKQMPKKVIFEDDGDSLLCPNCGLELMGSITEPDHDPYYCFECGQAIYWSEQNE